MAGASAACCGVNLAVQRRFFWGAGVRVGVLTDCSLGLAKAASQRLKPLVEVRDPGGVSFRAVRARLNLLAGRLAPVFPKRFGDVTVDSAESEIPLIVRWRGRLLLAVGEPGRPAAGFFGAVGHRARVTFRVLEGWIKRYFGRCARTGRPYSIGAQLRFLSPGPRSNEQTRPRSKTIR